MGLRYAAIIDDKEVEMIAMDTKLVVEEFNGAFDFQSAVKAGYSIGLKFPIEGNEIVFNYAHITAMRDRDTRIRIRIYDSHILRYVGYLLVQKIVKDGNTGYYDCDFVSINFNVAIEGKTLQDALDESYSMGDNISDIATNIGTTNDQLLWYPGTPKILAFVPTSVPSFYDDADGMSAFIGALNYFDRYDNEYPVNAEGEVKYSYSPSIYLLEVIQRIFAKYGYGTSGPVFDDNKMRRVLPLNLRAFDNIGQMTSALMKMTAPMVCSGTVDVVTFDTIASDFTSGESSVAGTTPYNVTSGVVYFQVLKIVTGENVSGATLSIRRSIGGSALVSISSPQPNTTYRVAFEHTYGASAAEGIAVGITAGGSVDIESMEWSVRETSATLTLWNKWQGNFKLGDCLPRMEIGAFLAACRKTYNIRFDVDDVARTCYVDFNKKVLTNADDDVVVEFAAKRQINNDDKKKVRMLFSNESFEIDGYDDLGAVDADVSITTEAPTLQWPGGVIYLRARNVYLKDGSDGEQPGKYESDYYGEGEEGTDISTGVTLPKMIWGALGDDPTQFYYPEWSEKGSSFWGGLGENDFPLMFVNFFGKDAWLPSTPEHPYATPYNLTLNGGLMDCYSLAPLNESGTVWNELWLPWLKKYVDGDDIEIQIPNRVQPISRLKFMYLEGVRFLPKNWKLPVGRTDGMIKIVLRRW